MSVGNPVILGTGGPVVVSGPGTNITASALVKTGDGYLAGIFMASGSATMKLWDNTAASGTVLVNTFTPVLGWNPIPFRFQNGLFVTITGTIDISVSYL